MNPMQQPEPILVSVNNAAAMLGISRPTIYKLLNAGALRAVKSGGRTLIPTQALREYAASLAAYVPATEERRPPAPEMLAFVQALARAVEARDWNETRRHANAICQELEPATEPGASRRG